MKTREVITDSDSLEIPFSIELVNYGVIKFEKDPVQLGLFDEDA